MCAAGALPPTTIQSKELSRASESLHISKLTRTSQGVFLREALSLRIGCPCSSAECDKAVTLAVDHDNDDYPVFESGAILMYLGEKAQALYPQEFNKRHEVNQWLFFQNAGVGPMQVRLAR